MTLLLLSSENLAHHTECIRYQMLFNLGVKSWGKRQHIKVMVSLSSVHDRVMRLCDDLETICRRWSLDGSNHLGFMLYTTMSVQHGASAIHERSYNIYKKRS